MADEKKEKSLELDSAISSFLLWCHDNDLKLNNKVAVRLRGSCHRYGMVAMEDISPDECLFKVPRGLLLEPKTCGISKILTGKVIQNMLSQHEGSSWVPLLLALMYEYTNPTSLWKPYMDIVPGIDILDQPMFWPDETRQSLLQGTGFEDDVEDDKQRIERQYFTVAVPIMKKFKKFFDLKRHSLSLYKHMAAFIMAYSFTEDSPSFHGNNVPVMVPMADILNHHSNNNARLEFGEEELSMVSTQHILKGGEVFNTYGQLANCHLLQSYGFVEGPDNPNDTVEIPLGLYLKVAKDEKQSKSQARIIDSKFQFMEEIGLVSANDTLVFAHDGSYVDGPSLQLFLQILHLDQGDMRKLSSPSSLGQEPLSDVYHLVSQLDDEHRESWNKILQNVVSEVGDGADGRGCGQNDERLGEKRGRSCFKAEEHFETDKDNDVFDTSKRRKNAYTKKNHIYEKNGDDAESDNDDDEDNGDNGKVYYGTDGEEANDDANDYSSEDDINSHDEDGDSEDDGMPEKDQRISYDELKQFPDSWRRTLKRVADEYKLKNFSWRDLSELDRKPNLSRREQCVRQIRQAQILVCQKICDLIT